MRTRAARTAALLLAAFVSGACTPRALPRVDDSRPPTVRLVSPAPGEQVMSWTPEIEIEYADDASGLLVPSFRVRINGADYTAEFDHHSRGAVGRISSVRPLPLGPNEIEVQIADREGNVGRTEATFVNAGGGWLLTRAAPGAEPQRFVELVLDASGSMSDMMGLQSRMEVAKAAVKSLVEGVPPETPLGLRVFEDCEAISARMPVEPVDRTRFAAEVDSVEPSGGTPIVASLLQSFDALSEFPGGQRIAVLVTDGGESCEGDLAQAAARARDAATRVIVIGFDIDDAGITDDLRQLAESTGGAFYDAREPEQLREALERSVLRLEYVVLDGEGEPVAEGEFGGEPLELPPGTYQVGFATVPAVIVPGVRIGSLTETAVVLRRGEGDELTGAVEGPRPAQLEGDGR